eukprot:COSAG01_NODE_722_length_14067_cov_145.626289_6_plen_59_part_00
MDAARRHRRNEGRAVHIGNGDHKSTGDIVHRGVRLDIETVPPQKCAAAITDPRANTRM